MSRDKLHRHQILLYEGDYERLGRIHATRAPSEVVRQLVRHYIENVERELRERSHARGTTDDKN